MPSVIIAMHGSGTASSMAEVANKLVGAGNVYAYDMSLDKDPKVAYNELKDLIIKKHRGGGVILLVDMGSLGMFGELISEETGIKIRVLDMVTTLMAIECSRKATIMRDVDEICEEVKDSIEYFRSSTSSIRSIIPKRENIILTVCTTGEGTAVKLKGLIEEKLGLENKNVQVIPLAVNDPKYVQSYVNRLSKDKKILAVVGAVNPNIYGVPFISISEVLIDNNFSKIEEMLKKMDTNSEVYEDVFKMLSSELENFDVSSFKKRCLEFLENLATKLEVDLDLDKRIGLIMHLACALNRLKEGREIPKSPRTAEIKSRYEREFELIKSELQPLEDFYNVRFSDDEVVNILSVLKEIYTKEQI